MLRARARGIFRHEPDLYGINVVNEPLETFGAVPYDNHFRRVLGPDYVAELFRMVDQEAPPWTDLVLNEIFVESNPAKADALVAMVADLVARDVPIDAVGLQTHLIFREPDWAAYRDLMERLTALGVEVHVSELDVPVAPTPARSRGGAGRSLPTGRRDVSRGRGLHGDQHLGRPRRQHLDRLDPRAGLGSAAVRRVRGPQARV